MTGDWLRKVLLACGPLSALVYIGWHELAALQWESYSRISKAISELHLTGASSKWMLDPWEGLVYNALLIAFGIGVWRSAEGSRALRAIGGLQIVSRGHLPAVAAFRRSEPRRPPCACRCGHLDVARIDGARHRGIRQTVPALLADKPGSGRGVQCVGHCLRAGSGRRGANATDRAL